MKKKLLLIPLACSVGLSLLAFTACGDKTNYGAENGGEPAVSTADQISLDGVLNESVYDTVGWVRGYAADPAVASTRDVDRIRTDAASAAKMNVSVFFRESGMYAAVDVTNEAGEAAYASEGRDESLNSGAELLFGNYKVKLSASGKYVWEQKTEEGWTAYTETQASALGVTAKTAPVNDAANTGYVLEFFVPAANLNAMGYDAAALANGRTVMQLDAVLVSSYAQDASSAARWELSSLLAWDYYYEFGKDGAELYDVTIETSGEKGGSMVIESALRDYAVPSNDTTFLIKIAEGYRLKSFLVNDQAYDVKYIQGDLQKGYVTLLTDEVTGDLHVSAQFEQNLPVRFEARAETLRFGSRTQLDGVTLTFERNGERYDFAVTDGKLAGELPYGVYTVTSSDGLYEAKEVAYGTDGMGTLNLTYKAFAADKFNEAYGGYLDYSRQNSGVLTNISGNSFFPITNEAFGDSAISATFKKSMMTEDGKRLGLRYIWNDLPNGADMRSAVIAEMYLQNNTLYAGWADYTDNWTQNNVVYGKGQVNALPASFRTAFEGDGAGVTLTLVRDGNTFILCAEIAGDASSRIRVTSFTLDEDLEEQAAMEGHWAAFIWNSANDMQVSVTVSEDISAWKYSVSGTSDATEGNRITAEQDVAVGEPMVYTIGLDENSTLTSLTVNGVERISEVTGNKLTLKDNVPLTMEVAAVFAEANFTANVNITDKAAARFEQDDLSLRFIGADGTHYAVFNGSAWRANLADGEYTYELSFEGGVLQRGTVNVGADTKTLSLTLSQIRILVPDQSTGSTSDLLGALGDFNEFVYTGFMGIASADGGTANIQSETNFAAETKFYFYRSGSNKYADCTTVEIQFVKWGSTYELKFMTNDDAQLEAGKINVSFMLTEAFSKEVFDQVCKDNGVTFAISAKNGVVRAWAQVEESTGDGQTSKKWVQLEVWQNQTAGYTPDYDWDKLNTGSVTRAQFRKRYSNTNTVAVLKDAQLWLDASIDSTPDAFFGA